MHVVDTASMLQFHEYKRFDEKIRNILADDNSIVFGDHCMLLHDGEPRFAHLVSQRVLVDLFEEAAAEAVTYGECTADDSFRYLVDSVPVGSHESIRVHLCSSVAMNTDGNAPARVTLAADRSHQRTVGLALAIAEVEADGVFVGGRNPPARDAAAALVALLVHLDQEGVDWGAAGSLAFLGARDIQNIVPALAAHAVVRLHLLADLQRPQPFRAKGSDEVGHIPAVRRDAVE